MNPVTIAIGSALAGLLALIYLWLLYTLASARGQKITVAQANRRALGVLVGVLIGLPVLWGLGVLIVAGFAVLPPVGHLLLWGSIGVLALLLGAFAGLRAMILRSAR